MTAHAMEFSRLPIYPIHNEPLLSQERLLQADREDRWFLFFLIVIPVTLVLLSLAMHLIVYGIVVGAGGLAGD
jgi:hypothetical protein